MNTSFFKKYKRPLLCVLVCALAFLVFAAVWFTEIRGSGGKSLNWAISDQFHNFEPVEEEFRQDFFCDRNLLAVSLVVAPDDPENPPEGTLELTITRAGSDEVLAQSVGDLRYILNGKDGYYTTLGLDREIPVDWSSPNAEYSMTVRLNYETEQRMLLAYEPGTNPRGTAFEIDGTPIEGMIPIKGVQARVGGFLTKFYWVIAFGCIALLGVCFWLFTSKKVKLHQLVFCLVLGLGILYNLVLPPYSVPDERFHINQSFSLASSLYDPDIRPTRTHMLHNLRRPSDSNALIQEDHPTVFTWQAYERALQERNEDPYRETVEREDEPQVQAGYMPYWISGLAVYLCFLLRMGFAQTLFLGRMANLLFFAFMAAWAVKKTPAAKPVFAAAALLPMTLHLAASYSRDSFLLALTFAFTALVLDSAFGPRETPNWVQLAVIAVMGGLIAAIKSGVYLPLVLLLLIIPAKRLGRRPALVKAGMVALCLALFVLDRGTIGSLKGILNLTPQPAVVQTQQVDTSAPEPAAAEQEPAVLTLESAAPAEETAAETSAPVPAEPTQDDSIRFTPGYCLTHPIETFALAFRSLVHLGDHYVRTLVGGTLGYFQPGQDLTIANVWVILLYLVLAFAWLCPGGFELSVRTKTVLAGLGLLCCAMAVAGCIVWTPTYYTTIYGFQGRYLLPALPFLLLCRPKTFTLSCDCSRGLTFGMLLLDIGVLLNVFLAVVAR